MDIDALLEDLKEKYLRTYEGIEAIVLVGSYAKECATDISDIDLCIIGDFETFRRHKEVYRHKDIELMLASYSWYREVITQFERQDNYGTITGMLACGKCLYPSSRVIELMQEARLRYLEGPKPCSMEEKIRLKNTLERLQKDYHNTNQKSIEFKWMTFKLLDVCIDALFKLNKWWYLKDNQKLAFIQSKDQDTYRLITKVMDVNDKNSLIKLCSKIKDQL